MSTVDTAYHEKPGENTIYLAGGCFWETEHLLSMLDGVTDAVSGYANGHVIAPSYQEVRQGWTGARECVRCVYDKKRVSLEELLEAFYLSIDPHDMDVQGADRGSQYRSGIFYADKESMDVVEEFMRRKKASDPAVAVDHGPLRSFFVAEEYHQDYLDRNPTGYCHISPARIEYIVSLQKEGRLISQNLS